MEVDREVVEELLANLLSFLISAAGDFREEAQSGGSVNAVRQFASDVDRPQRGALPGPREVTEQAMFDRIVLGAAGRVVSDFDVASQVVCQMVQGFLEAVMPMAVTATTADSASHDRNALVSG